MGHRTRRGLISVAFLAVLMVAGTASAAPITLPLSDFLIFSSTATNFAGASLFEGNIGSNGDIGPVAGDTQILGSVYAGGNFDFGQDGAIGSDGITPGATLEPPLGTTAPIYTPALTAEVVVNGNASIGGGSNIYGNLSGHNVTLGQNTGIRLVGGSDGNVQYTNNYNAAGTSVVEGLVEQLLTADRTTFGTVTLPTATPLTLHGTNHREVDGATNTFLGEGTYGDLTTASTGETLTLESGDYYFDSIDAKAEFTLRIDLTNGPINIYVVGEANFGGQDNELWVKGPGMTDYVLISDPSVQHLAGRINWETHGTFTLGGGDAGTWGSIWGGILYSYWDGTGHGIDNSQRIDWYGALYAVDSISLLDHSRYTYIPEPTTALLLACGLAGLAAAGRGRSLH